MRSELCSRARRKQWQEFINIERLSELAAKPASDDPYAEMDPIQKSNFIAFLQDMLIQKEKEHQEDRELLTDIKNQLSETARNLKESISNQQKLEKQIADLQMQLAQEKAANSTLRYDNETLKARLEIKQNQQFGTKSHDRRKSKNSGKQRCCHNAESYRSTL